MKRLFAHKKNIIDYLIIFASLLISAVAGFASIKIAQLKFNKSEFESYVLMLRYAGFIVPIMTIGMGIAVPRYIGLNGEKFLKNASPIISTSLISITVASIAFALISYLFYSSIDRLLFEGKNYYIYAIMLYISLTFYALSYSVLRGLKEFKNASVLEIFVKAVMLLAPLLVLSSLSDYLITYSIVTLFITAFVIIKKIRKIEFNYKIVRFGISRIPSNLLYPSLFSIPVLFASNMVSPAYAAKLSIFIMIMNAFLLPAYPFSVMILPKLGQFFIHKNNKNKMNIILLFSIFMGLISTALYLVIGTYLVKAFSYNIEKDYYVLAGVLFFNVIFIVLRDVLDGLYEKSYLLRLLLIALITECVTIFFIHFSFQNRYISLSLLLSTGVLVLLLFGLLYMKGASSTHPPHHDN